MDFPAIFQPVRQSMQNLLFIHVADQRQGQLAGLIEGRPDLLEMLAGDRPDRCGGTADVMAHGVVFIQSIQQLDIADCVWIIQILVQLCQDDRTFCLDPVRTQVGCQDGIQIEVQGGLEMEHT